MRYLILTLLFITIGCSTQPEEIETDECKTEVIHYPCPSGDCVTCLD